MGLSEALSELEGVDPAEAAQALEEKATGIFKAIRTPAYKEGKQEGEKEAEKAQGKIASLRKENQELTSKLEEAQGEQPELAELRGKYEQKLEDMQQKLKAKDEELSEVQTTWQGKAKNVKVTGLQDRIASHLKAKGVDPDYADYRAEQAVRSGRVKVSDDDLEAQFFEDDDAMVPLSVSGDTPADQAFANEVLSSIPDKFIADHRPGSTGVGDGMRSTGDALQVKRSELGNDVRAYERAKKRAQEAGKKLQIVDE